MEPFRAKVLEFPIGRRGRDPGTVGAILVLNFIQAAQAVKGHVDEKGQFRLRMDDAARLGISPSMVEYSVARACAVKGG